MAEAGLQAPDIPGILPPPAQPAPQAPQQPAQLVPQPSQQGQQMVYLNWSHFQAEFLGKPEEDAEAHLLRTNNWMNAHHFLEGMEVERQEKPIRPFKPQIYQGKRKGQQKFL